MKLWALALFLAGGMSVKAAPVDPAGYWKLDEGSGSFALDSSGNAGDGVLQAGTWGEGKSGSAICIDRYQFDFSVTSPSNLLRPASYTQFAWVKISSKIWNWSWIATQGDNYGLYVSTSGVPTAYINNGNAYKKLVAAGQRIDDGQWHSVASSYDSASGEFKIYVDGIESNTLHAPGYLAYKKGKGFNIGSLQGKRQLPGCVDEVSVFGRVLSASDIVQLHQGGNQTPTLELGADLTLQMPTGPYGLVYMVSDDGPLSALDISWRMLSGPSAPDFVVTHPNRVTMEFFQAGEYLLEATASDGTNSASDTVRVAVLEQNVPQNQPPLVDAGSDQVLQLPASTLQLTGSASDDGHPQGQLLSLRWQQLSGPGLVSSITPASATTAAETLSLTSTVEFLPEPGTYVFQLEASDGEHTVTDTVSVELSGTVNTPPEITMGPGGTHTLTQGQAGISLTATVTDDAVPPFDTLHPRWFLLSGPAPVEFDPVHAINTTARFSATGTYIIELEVHDNDMLSHKRVTVTIVDDSTPPTGQPVLPDPAARWSFDAGATAHVLDISGNGNDGMLSNIARQEALFGKGICTRWSNQRMDVPAVAARMKNTDVSVSGWFKTTHPLYNWAWIASQSNNYGLYLSKGGTPNFYVNTSAGRQTLGASALLNDGEWHHLAGVWDAVGRTMSIYVDGVKANQRSASGSTKWLADTAFSIGALSGKRTFPGCFDEVQVYDRALTTADINVLANKNGGSGNQAPTIDNLNDISITLPNNETGLSARFSDDGLPGSGLTTQWRQIDGPEQALLINPDEQFPTVRFNVAGRYTFEVTASDGELQTSGTMVVTVHPPLVQNQAPRITYIHGGGAVVGGSVMLIATVEDDGLPTPRMISTRWALESGPATVDLRDDQVSPGDLPRVSHVSVASFSAIGTYVFRFEADDGELSVTETVNVVVTEADPNQPPVVDAGADATITWPQNTYLLQPTVTDDGLPRDQLLYFWIKRSGPGSVSFVDSRAKSTEVMFSEPGVYVLELEAVDYDLGATDTLQITVLPEVAPPPGEPVLSDPVGRWGFDSAPAGLISDLSGNGNNGYLNNGALADAQYGKAACFSGRADVAMNNAGATLQPQSVTLSAWVKTSGQLNNWSWIAAQGDNYGLYLSSNGTPKFYVRNGGALIKLSSSVDVSDGQWHHVAGSFDASTNSMRLYVNGSEAGSTKAKQSISFTHGDGFTVGSMQGRRNLPGCVDEVQVYGRALDLAELQVLAGNAVPAQPDDVNQIVSRLASDEFAGRGPQSAGLATDTEYLIDQLQLIAGGIHGGRERASYLQSFASGSNILAVIPGTAAPDEYLVLGAHYDHLGAHCSGGSAADMICNGATDNATGVAAVLELGRHFAKFPPARSVILALWDAEEPGLHGSASFMAHPPVALNTIVAYMNFDLMGISAQKSLKNYTFITASNSGGFGHVVGQVAEQNTLDVLLMSSPVGRNRSDHASFLDRSIPAINFTDGSSACYHNVADEVDVVDFPKLGAQIDLARSIANLLLDQSYTPRFYAYDHARLSDAVETLRLLEAGSSEWSSILSLSQRLNVLTQMNTLRGWIDEGESFWTHERAAELLSIVSNVQEYMAVGECQLHH